MGATGRVLLLGTKTATAQLARMLRRSGLSVATATSSTAALDRIGTAPTPFDALCIVADTPTSNADQDAELIALLHRLAQAQPELALVVLDDRASVAVTAVAAGATFVGTLNAGPTVVRGLISRAVELIQLRRAHATLQSAATENRRLRADAAQALAEAHQYERELQSIEAAASTINNTHQLEDVLPQICRTAVELFGVDHSVLVIFDEAGDSGTVQAEFPPLGAYGAQILVRGIPAEERLVYNREPLILDSVAMADPADLGSIGPLFMRFGIQSILIVPVISEGRVIGSFSLDAIAQPRRFSAKDVELCHIFAAHIAAALEKARLLLAARQQADQMDALRKMTFAITSERDPAHLLQMIVAHAVELLHAQGGGIYVYDAQRRLLELRAACGHAPELLGTQLYADEGMAGYIVAQDLPFLIVPDYPNWSGRAAIYAEQCPFEAVIAVPLRWEGRTLGVLFVNAERGRVFTTHDADLLRFFADHAAIALGNAALLRDSATTRVRLQQLRGLFERITVLVAQHAADGQVQQLISHAAHVFDVEAQPYGYDALPPASAQLVPVVGEPVNNMNMADGANRFAVPNGPTPAAMHNDQRASAELRRDLLPTTELVTERPLLEWQQIFAAVPGAIIVNDLAGTVIAATERAATLLGLEQANLLGKAVQTIFADPQVARRIGRLLHETHNGRVVEETFLRGASAELLPVRINVNCIHNAHGDHIGAVGYIEDLRSLHVAEARLQLLVDVNRLLTTADGVSLALRRLGEQLVRSLPLAFCRIALLDAQGRLVIHAAEAADDFRWDSGLGAIVTPAEWPELAGALSRSEPTVLASPDTSAWFQRGRAQLPDAGSIGSLVLMPLRDGAALVGLIELAQWHSVTAVGLSADDRWLIKEVANHTAPLIERMRLQERVEYHRLRLARLEHAARVLRLDSADVQFTAEMLRLAVDILQQTLGVLYVIRPQLGELEIVQVYGLPAALIGRVQPIGAGLASQVAQHGESLLGSGLSNDPTDLLAEYNLQYALAAPIEQSSERVAVLLVGGVRRDAGFSEIDLSILARFALQAGSAMQTAQLLGREQRMVGWMTLLGRFSRFCQETDDEDQILHALLTAITAGYGLRFNRGMLFLLNDRKDMLIGKLGIGHLQLEQAAHDWETSNNDGVAGFHAYLAALQQDSLAKTPLDARVYRLALPLTQHEPDALLQLFLDPQLVRLDVDDLEDALPPELIDLMAPGGPTALVPLVIAGEVQGVVIVDNVFTQAPISDDDCEALLAFVHMVAVALNTRRLVRDYAATRTCLGALLDTSRELGYGAADSPDAVLQVTVSNLRAVMKALWVSIILINDLGEVSRAISTRDGIFAAQGMIRPDGVSMEVLRSGTEQLFEQTERHRDRLQPVVFKRGVGAAACFPLMLSERRIGVVWIHWKDPHTCLPAESTALQLYLNQAAMAYDNACRIRVLDQIHRAAEGVAAAHNWQAVLEQVARHGCGLLHGTAAVVWAYDARAGYVTPERSAGYNIALESWRQIQLHPPQSGDPVDHAFVDGWFAATNTMSAAQREAFGPSMNLLLTQTDARAFQIVGLQLAGVVLGALVVLYNRPQTFGLEDRETAELFANYAALVVRQADLLESLRLTNSRLDAAQETVRLVANASVLDAENIDLALRSIVEGTQRLLAADTVVIYACDPGQRRLSHAPVWAGVSNAKSVAQQPQVLRDSLVTRIMEQKEIQILGGVQDDPRFDVSHFVRREGIVTSAAGPLIYRGVCVGAIFVSYRRPHTFTAEEIGHINVLADQAAIAIRNDQLYRERQRRVVTLEAIQDAGRVVTGALVRDVLGRAPLEVTLNRIVEQSLLLISPEVRDRSFSHLALVEGNTLRNTAAYPVAHLDGLRQKIGDIDLTGEYVGVTGRAVQLKRALRIDNVHQTEYAYLCYDPAVTSELAVPIMIGTQVIGVINLEHPRECAFDLEDERALQALAGYAATAIQNARLYACLETVEDISRRVALNEPSDTLLADLCRQLQAASFPGCLVTVRLHDREVEPACLLFNPAWSSGGVGGDIVPQPFGQGICGYVAERRVPVRCGDVTDPAAEPAYIELSPKPFPTRSELCVPIFWGETEILGVLDVQSPCVDAFAPDDQQLLEIVANQIAAALSSARYIKSLHSLRGIVGGRTNVAMMRTVVNIWRHEVEEYAQNIRTQVHMATENPPQQYTNEEWIALRLREIHTNASRIFELITRSLTPALRADEGIVTADVDDLIRRRIQKLWLLERYTAALPSPELQLNARAIVRVNPELFLIAVELLVRNAVEAMNAGPTSRLTIVTCRRGPLVEVRFHDSGPGIPSEVQRVLFKEQVVRPDRERLRGTGLLIVRAIVEAYGGQVKLAHTDAQGTTMLLTLPMESSP